MRKMLLTLAVTLTPALSWAMLSPSPHSLDLLKNQPHFSAYSETTTMEWGCPVAEMILANSKAEALSQVRAECLDEARRAAASKPDVMDVLATEVIWPDVQVYPVSEGFQLTGTFFLKTTVVQRTYVEVR